MLKQFLKYFVLYFVIKNNKKMIQYSIKDLEKLSGIKAHTIRIWELRYQVVTPHRTSTNIRFYTDRDLHKIMNIAALGRMGLKISHLAGLSNEELNEKIIDVFQRVSTGDTKIDQLILAMTELDDNKFQNILSNASINRGFENTIIEVLFPFLDSLGLLWQTGNINTAHECFVLNILRQKLLVAIDGIYSQHNKNSKLIMMFLPRGEYHEIELLFYRYVLSKAGHKIIYLGQSIPFEDLSEITNFKSPDFLFTCVNKAYSNTEMKSFLNKISTQFPNQSIFVAGRQILQYTLALPDNVVKVASIQEFKDKMSI